MKKWITFFSQSGSEICNISKKLKRTPDLIITNRESLVHPKSVHAQIFNNIEKLVFLPKSPTATEYETAIKLLGVPASDILITLHGYLRILPASICKKYEIINGHPGLINVYPELKGKDPQDRAVNYPVIGSVLHRVTEVVDDGEIISSASCDNYYNNAYTISLKLKSLSHKLWVDFLAEQFSL